jgi:heptosyltransferase III
MPRSAVVFQIGSLGDSIVSLPALRSLRDLLPDCDDYILVDRFDNALKVVPAEVFELVMKPKKRLNYRGGAASRLGRMWSVASLSTQLRYYRPHYSVYLMPSDRTEVQVARDRTFFRSMGVTELLGFRHLTHQDRAEDLCPSKQCGEAYLRLRRLWSGQTDEQFSRHGRTPMFEPSASAASQQVEQWLHAKRRFSERLLVAVSPFSNCSSKDLNIANTAELIRRLEEEGVLEAVIVGGAKDTAPATSVLDRSGAGLNGCGVFSVGETAALLQKCRLAIAVDSGPMHLAAAVGTPTVAVYSRTNPHLDRWFPLGTGHTILYREVACAGCGEQVCPLSGHPCIDDISVDEIFGAVLHTLGMAPLPESRTGTRILTL